ncbi:T9SS type A sorting domain-containing protein [Runella salmonicolor]|uniref:T9SS type A sorting domain-containing protein n=1 Tax=Runella salmonicolor TaxID=2950278 RepID=A0ABT1FSR3_9BACT|nr:T9SS type A sorting domain-containing protein [Runella salmonicolor]MCP1383673.1 T9SS type A sorting domain-containing protein [Runella salmonicolor]
MYNEKVTLRYYLEKGQKARLRFSNLTGSVITQKTLVGEGGWQQDQTDLSHQPNGAYLLRFEADKRTITRKFMIVK